MKIAAHVSPFLVLSSLMWTLKVGSLAVKFHIMMQDKFRKSLLQLAVEDSYFWAILTL